MTAEIITFPMTKEMQEWANSVNDTLAAHQEALEVFKVALEAIKTFMVSQDSLNKNNMAMLAGLLK